MVRAARSLLVVVLLSTSCTFVSDDDEFADPGLAAADFLRVWDRGDAGEMRRRFDGDAARIWADADLGDWLEEQRVDGMITAVDVEPDGPVQSPSERELQNPSGDVVAFAPYTITYTSRAAAGPVALQGRLPLEYDRPSEEWQVRWRIEHMWPGLAEARGFEVSYDWGRRGTIVDRRGAVLAAGPAEARRYPAGATAGSTVGHLEPLARKDVADAPPGKRAGDLVGGSGLEKAFESALAGRPATTLAIVDIEGNVVRRVGRRRGRGAGRVRSTLDLRVQRAAAAAFGSTTGGAVVLHPRTGDLLAVVSSSEFNPANYVGARNVSPFNRALSGLYAPGSSLKVMTAAAALDSGAVKLSTRLTGPASYRGVRNYESGEYASLDLATAMKHSVNTAFAQVAQRLGPRRSTRYAERFGFNRDPAMPLDAATSSFPPPEDEGDLMWSAIGQAQVLATPLQMATIAATIANEGARMEPRVSSDGDPDGRRVVSKRVAARITEMMEGVVVGGTGQRARISGVRVAGKTGTAEIDVGGERLNHAWFICFAPIEAPKVAVAVVAEYGGVGGQVAAPIAGDILHRVLPLVR